jgi:hypothetical protein
LTDTWVPSVTDADGAPCAVRAVERLKELRRGLPLRYSGGMRSALLVGFAVLGGCDTEGDKPALASHGKEAKSVPVAAVPASASSAAGNSAEPVPLPPEEDAKLRRKYGAADMKYNECIKRVDATLQGRGCPSAIMVFGPYVNVPGNSEIEFSFEIRSPTGVDVYSDMGSQVGKRALGAIATQTLAANEKRRIGYKINMASPDTAVETRVWVHGAGPVDFDITNLNVTVR